MEDRYVILSGVHKVGGPFPIGRYFWLLGKVKHNGVEEYVSTIEAIHGLASIQRLDINNHRFNYKLRRTGGKSSCITAFRVPKPDVPLEYYEGATNASSLTLTDTQYWVEPDKTHIVYGNSSFESDAKDRWKHAVRHLKLIDDQKVPYSKLGVGNLSFLNGNTAYCVVAGLMDIKPYVFPAYLSPGMDADAVNQIIPEANLKRLFSQSQSAVAVTPHVSFLNEERYTIQVGVTPLSKILTNEKKGKKAVKGSHYFFILNRELNGNKETIEAIHGLPTEKSQWGYAPKSNSHNAILQAYCLQNPSQANRKSALEASRFKSPWISPEKTGVVYGNRVGEYNAQEKWQRAKDYMMLFNTQELPYTIHQIGFSLLKHCTNGNSLYCAVSEIMEITPPYYFEHYSKAGFNTIAITPGEVESVAALAAKRAQKKRDTQARQSEKQDMKSHHISQKLVVGYHRPPTWFDSIGSSSSGSASVYPVDDGFDFEIDDSSPIQEDERENYAFQQNGYGRAMSPPQDDRLQVPRSNFI